MGVLISYSSVLQYVCMSVLPEKFCEGPEVGEELRTREREELRVEVLGGGGEGRLGAEPGKEARGVERRGGGGGADDAERRGREGMGTGGGAPGREVGCSGCGAPAAAAAAGNSGSVERRRRPSPSRHRTAADGEAAEAEPKPAQDGGGQMRRHVGEVAASRGRSRDYKGKKDIFLHRIHVPDILNVTKRTEWRRNDTRV